MPITKVMKNISYFPNSGFALIIAPKAEGIPTIKPIKLPCSAQGIFQALMPITKPIRTLLKKILAMTFKGMGPPLEESRQHAIPAKTPIRVAM